MLDVEVGVDAALQFVEHRPEVPVVEARVVNDYVRGEDGQPGGDLAGMEVADVPDAGEG